MHPRFFLKDSVNLGTLGKDPEAFLRAAPVAVLDGDQVLGYLLDPPMFEELMALAVDAERRRTVKGRFRMSQDGLSAIGREGVRLLSEATEADMAEYSRFTECLPLAPEDDQDP